MAMDVNGTSLFRYQSAFGELDVWGY